MKRKCDCITRVGIDCKVLPYVSPRDFFWKTKGGIAWLPKGALQNGSSGVSNVDMIASGFHDMGYVLGGLFVVERYGDTTVPRFQKMEKLELDQMYMRIVEVRARVLPDAWAMISHMFRGYVHYIGLRVPFISRHIWNSERAHDSESSPEQRLRKYIVPNSDKWIYDCDSWRVCDLKEVL